VKLNMSIYQLPKTQKCNPRVSIFFLNFLIETKKFELFREEREKGLDMAKKYLDADPTER
jgi:hypothetical protein